MKTSVAKLTCDTAAESGSSFPSVGVVSNMDRLIVAGWARGFARICGARYP